MLNYYSWIESFSDLSDFQNLCMQLNWEDSSFLLETDFFFIFNIINESWIINSFSTVFISYFSFLDFFILNFFLNNFITLYDSFFYDFWLYFNIIYIKNYLSFFFMNSDYFIFFSSLDQDIFLFFDDFMAYLSLFNFNIIPYLYYDSYLLTLSFSYLDYIIWIKWFILFFLSFSFILNVIRYLKLNKNFNFFWVRNYLFFKTVSLENRTQFDVTITFLIFVLLIWIVVLITFDDIFIEVVELFHIFLVLLFFGIVCFLLFKYSLHYFSFLENTTNDGYTTAFIFKQMVRDLSNTFALFLRFFLLFFRMNIYDGLDDFLDSYYIFFCDFDENSYFDENIFFNNSFFYFFDNNEDLIFFNAIEQDFTADIWEKYYIIWGKLFFFIFFILEEVFRISLALYIFYLIIFEVHSVNVSYLEDSFILQKKN